MYEITDGKIFKLDELPFAPRYDNLYDGTDIFALPLNPADMYFDFFTEDDGFQYPAFSDFYSIGEDGLPVNN